MHFFRTDAKPLLQNLNGIRQFLLLSQCHAQIVGVGYLLGMIVETTAADVLHTLFIILFCIVLQQFPQSSLIAWVHIQHLSHCLAEIFLGLLAIDLIRGFHDEHLGSLLGLGEQGVKGSRELRGIG